MHPDPDEFAESFATALYRQGQPLGAAIVFADVARSTDRPAVWCGLGASLMASRGRLVRKPFEDWAARVFARGAPVFAGTSFEPAVAEWRRELPGLSPALTDAEFPVLVEFLFVTEQVLTDAVATLPEDDRMGAVMALGDRGRPAYLPLLRAAIEGRLGPAAARSALKRIAPFLHRADLRASLVRARATPGVHELEPYLSFVLGRLPDGWDAPRTAAAPAYEGIGSIDLELVDAGRTPDAVASVLQDLLWASPTDARSWVAFAPCTVKRGAVRSDAVELEGAVKAAGGTLRVSPRSG